MKAAEIQNLKRWHAFLLSRAKERSNFTLRIRDQKMAATARRELASLKRIIRCSI